MKVVLELQDQPSNVRRITIRHDIVIGRGSDCNLRLSAPQVSRRHCFLRVGRDSVSVTDLDSSNGTFVDGRRIAAGKRCDVSDGVQLALGPIRFIVHVRARATAADGTKLNSQAGNADEFPGTDSGRYSVAQQGLADDSSTIDGRSLARKSKATMDFAVEQGGESAESHAATDEDLGRKFSNSGSSGVFPPDQDPMDSRLEIIDFGRRLSEESARTDETRAVSDTRNSGRSEMAEDGEPRWASSIIDSSGSPEDVDVLGIADDSSVSCGLEDERSLESQTSIPDAREGRTGNVKEVLPTDEFLSNTEDVHESDGGSNWFSGAIADQDNRIHRSGAAKANRDAADGSADAADENDPNLRDFLKGS